MEIIDGKPERFIPDSPFVMEVCEMLDITTEMLAHPNENTYLQTKSFVRILAEGGAKLTPTTDDEQSRELMRAWLGFFYPSQIYALEAFERDTGGYESAELFGESVIAFMQGQEETALGRFEEFKSKLPEHWLKDFPGPYKAAVMNLLVRFTREMIANQVATDESGTHS